MSVLSDEELFAAYVSGQAKNSDWSFQDGLRAVAEAAIAADRAAMVELVMLKKIDCIDTDYKYVCGWNDCRDAMFAPAPIQDKGCENCHKCLRDVMENGLPVTSQRMIVCPECHNKRCPKASNHNLKCTNSNEPGQAGSIYTGGPAIKNEQELTDEELKRIPVFYNADSGEIDEVSTFRAVISEHENKKRKSYER